MSSLFDSVFGEMFGSAGRQGSAPTLAHLKGCLTIQTWLGLDGKTRFSRISYMPPGGATETYFQGVGSIDDAMRAAAVKLGAMR